jgi:FixJ family two-component response regulator
MEHDKKQEKKKYPEFPVLVVDDDKNFLNSIDFILRSRGITNIECCAESREVILRLKSRKYSVILLDLKMQGITGEELLEKIVEEYSDIPVIILTAVDMVDIAVKCIKQGAVDYLVKPVNTEKLIKTIGKSLEREPKQSNREEESIMNSVSTVKIFVASGSELKKERKETVQIINELNKPFPFLNLKVVQWETDIPSGSYDKQYIQDQINTLLEPCEVVLVIFYSQLCRFTLEEYRLAREKNKKVFLYFKTGFSPKDKTECDSYGEVLEFRDEIKKEGRVLFKEYRTHQSFREALRSDLTLYLSQNYKYPALKGSVAEEKGG